MKKVSLLIKLTLLLVVCSIVLLLAYLALAGYVGSEKTQLFNAAYIGNWERVKTLVDRGIDVNAKDKYGQTLLILASYRNDKDIVTLLISKGADTNIHNASGSTPLHCASRRGLYQIAQILIDNNAKVNSRDRYGRTPLFYSVSSGPKELLEILLRNGAEINIMDESGWTPLHTALRSWPLDPRQYPLYDIVELLIKHGADVNAKNQGGPNRDSRDSHVGVRMRPPNKGETPLEIALSYGYTDIVQLLIEHGATETPWGILGQSARLR